VAIINESEEMKKWRRDKFSKHR